MSNYVDNLDIFDAAGHGYNVLIRDSETNALAVSNKTEIGVLSNLDTQSKTNLVTAINENVSRIAANALAISTEVTNRQAADAVLDNNINNEATQRQSADAQIWNAINNLKVYDRADIRNYGGVADGVTDCTAAVAASLAENNVAYLPNYNNQPYIVGAVTLAKGQTVIGDEGATINSSAATLFTITDNNVEIKNLIINTSGNVIYINTADRAISFIHIENVYSYGADKFIYDNQNAAYNYTNLYVDRCAARQHRGHGIITYKCVAFFIMNNVTIDSVGVVGTASMFEIHNNAGAHFTRCEAEGGYSDGSHATHAGFNIINSQAVWLERCMADTVDGAGFNFSNTQYIYMIGCVSSLVGSHGIAILGETCANILITNCFIGGRRGMSSSVAGAHGIYNYGSYFTISNCDIVNMTGYAIADAARNPVANYASITMANCDRSFVAFGSYSGTVCNICSAIADVPTPALYKIINSIFNNVEWQFNNAVRYTGSGYEYFNNGSWLPI